MKYFNDNMSLQDVEKRHKELVKKYHPDTKFGSEDIMKEINEEKDDIIAYLQGKKIAEKHGFKNEVEKEQKSASNQRKRTNWTRFDYINKQNVEFVEQKAIDVFDVLDKFSAIAEKGVKLYKKAQAIKKALKDDDPPQDNLSLPEQGND